MTVVGAHDSFAFSEDPFIRMSSRHSWGECTSFELIVVSRDQEVDIPTQLQLGVRLLQAQAHL